MSEEIQILKITYTSMSALGIFILYLFYILSHYGEDNIKVDLQEMGGGCGDWMELAQDRDRWRALVSTVMNLRFP